MNAQDALWSKPEVALQAEQMRGQLTVWDALDDIGEVERGSIFDTHPDAWQVSE